jgi:thiol-disulfide isomerase/thioredoxin
MKKKTLLVGLTLSGFLLFGCGEEEKYQLQTLKQELKTELKPLEGKEKQQITAVVKAIIPQSWELLEIYKVPKAEKDYLKKYLIRVYSPYQHAVFNKFVWFTKDGELLFSQTYKVENRKVSLIVPVKEKEYPLENISWVSDVERVALNSNLPITLTEGKKTIYIVWNPYCKTCFQKWKDILKAAQEKNLTVKLIPYHNVYYPIDNLYALIYIFWRAQNEGLFNVLNGYYTRFQSFDDFLNSLKEEAFKKLKNVPRESYNNIGFALKQISKTLAVSKIFVVPTTVEIKETDKLMQLVKGYVYVGEIKLK